MPPPPPLSLLRVNRITSERFGTRLVQENYRVKNVISEFINNTDLDEKIKKSVAKSELKGEQDKWKSKCKQYDSSILLVKVFYWSKLLDQCFMTIFFYYYFK